MGEPTPETALPSTYENRLLRVLDYIHDNPDGDLSLDALADVAAMSRFHWHRVFHGMTGETCAQATRRIRLHRAAAWLVQTDWPVDQIARRVGIPNRQSFTRIFREGFGMTPGRFRNQGALRPFLLRKDRKDLPMYNVELRDFPAKRLGAIAHRGAYLKVGKAFEKASALATTRNLWPHADGMMGIYYDDPNAVPEAELRSHAGIVLSGAATLPDEMEDIRIAPGRVAVLTYKGSYAGLKAAYDFLFGEWLPKSGEEPRDDPAMENYLNTPMDTAPEELLTEIILPIK